MARKVHFQGFSLIEVSISLLIVGIISVIGISQLRIMQRIYASQETQSNIDFVVKALGVYYFTSTTSPLPFPSKIDSNIGYQSESMKHSFGIIPFKSLGIMEKFAKDGNGRWLLYKVNPDFIKFIPFFEHESTDGSEFSSGIPKNKVAFVIKTTNSKNEDELLVEYDLQKLSYLNAKLSRLPVSYPMFPTARQKPGLYKMITQKLSQSHRYYNFQQLILMLRNNT